jgi:hypothetical protein
VVHFRGVWAIQGLDGEVFSDAGDSGSLVVSDDGRNAIGLIFAGVDGVSLMIPLSSIMDHWQLKLVTGHNI